MTKPMLKKRWPYFFIRARPKRLGLAFQHPGQVRVRARLPVGVLLEPRYRENRARRGAHDCGDEKVSLRHHVLHNRHAGVRTLWCGGTREGRLRMMLGSVAVGIVLVCGARNVCTCAQSTHIHHIITCAFNSNTTGRFGDFTAPSPRTSTASP